ncbi:helix-turn-helix domain-containing protein [Paenibacillus phocaensis]|jgi:DNA-binding MarR family transcriptional regulator|uniref:helix-turn-helix domain-containing protein n=1 Tax=Paenibacillus phocaensis TaxID=1776378 RepID=UPI000839BEE6|nr:helix-turn-helix domain-containing protein [Paenibacillus phocaensis]
MEFPNGYFKGPNDIFDYGLGPYQLIVYLYLVRCGNNDAASFPSLRTIEKKTGISRPKVIKTLDELEALGLIEKKKRAGGAKSNVYKIITPERSKLCH